VVTPLVSRLTTAATRKSQAQVGGTDGVPAQRRCAEHDQVRFVVNRHRLTSLLAKIGLANVSSGNGLCGLSFIEPPRQI
jgi:hypothetical protein